MKTNHYGVKEAAAKIRAYWGKVQMTPAMQKAIKKASKYFGPNHKPNPIKPPKKPKQTMGRWQQHGKVKVMIKRKPIRRATATRAKQLVQYRKRVHEWLSFPTPCGNCGARATECHHKYGRAGKLLNWEAGWIPLCQNCHQMTHAAPEWARLRRLLCDKGQWNDQRLVK